MVSDSNDKGSVLRCPKIRCYFRIDIENDFIIDRISVQNNFGGLDAFAAWRVIDTTVRNRRELCSVLLIKNNTFYGVGIITSVFSVYNDITNSYFTYQRLTVTFRMDYP